MGVPSEISLPVHCNSAVCLGARLLSVMMTPLAQSLQPCACPGAPLPGRGLQGPTSAHHVLS